MTGPKREREKRIEPAANKIATQLIVNPSSSKNKKGLISNSSNVLKKTIEKNNKLQEEIEKYNKIIDNVGQGIEQLRTANKNLKEERDWNKFHHDKAIQDLTIEQEWNQELKLHRNDLEDQLRHQKLQAEINNLEKEELERKIENKSNKIDELFSLQQNTEKNLDLVMMENQKLENALKLERYRNHRLEEDCIYLKQLNGTLHSELNDLDQILEDKNYVVKNLISDNHSLEQENQTLKYHFDFMVADLNLQKENLIEQHHYEREMQKINFNEILEKLNAEHEDQIALLREELHQTHKTLERLEHQ